MFGTGKRVFLRLPVWPIESRRKVVRVGLGVNQVQRHGQVALLQKTMRESADVGSFNCEPPAIRG